MMRVCEKQYGIFGELATTNQCARAVQKIEIEELEARLLVASKWTDSFDLSAIYSSQQEFPNGVSRLTSGSNYPVGFEQRRNGTL
jgi:hypothetical protein